MFLIIVGKFDAEGTSGIADPGKHYFEESGVHSA